MRTSALIVTGLLMLAGTAAAKTPEEYLNEAAAIEAAGDLAGASAALEPALAEHPDNAMILSKAGMYLATLAGTTNDQKDQIQFILRSFDLLDRAVSLAPDNPLVRFQRGMIFTQVPAFLSKYGTGIEDLESVVAMAEAGGNAFPPDMVVAALFSLGAGYRTAGRFDEARAVWTRVADMTAGSPMAAQVENAITGLDDAATAKTARQMVDEISDITELKRQLEDDPENPELLMALMQTMGHESEVYDERTYTDTSFRSLMAIESISAADRLLAVTDDPSIRLVCASIYVEMPFFGNRLEKGIAELQALTAGDAPEEIKAEAAYLLGCAWQKMATTAWIDAVTKYPGTESADLALHAMYPLPTSIAATESGPGVEVSFDLAFRDELAPQTAVWIENARGGFVRTLYVSGFSGFAREKQENLPRWSRASEYVDADAVTAASIDTGRHIYRWDCRDAAGKAVPAGDYTVKIECSWWPSMQYERAEAAIEVGGAGDAEFTDTGSYIPFLDVKYIPAK